MSTFGESLKRERELRQISLREIAEATKINLRYLDALETNEFDNLPGGVFNRGFVRAYAQYIGADADSLVNAYLLESQEQFARTGSQQLLRRLAEAKGREGEGARAAPGAAARRLGVVTLVTLGVAAAGAGLWYGFGQRGSGADSTVAEKAPAAVTDLEPPEATTTTASTTPVATGTADGSSSTSESGEIAAEPPETPPAASPEKAEQVVKQDSPPVLAAAGSAAESGAPAPAPRDDVIRARLVIARETSGRLNCDGRRVEMLDGMPAGTAFEITCRSFLVLDATDGGAVKLGLGGATPVALVADGVPLRGHRIVPGARGARDDGAPS
jgi:cytoskeletal protein RodZ